MLLSPGGYAEASASHTPMKQLVSRIMRIRHLQADFRQVLTNPHQDMRRVSHGKMWISKPDHFKWQTTSPNHRLLVSNGDKLWNYDQDLKQVTVQQVPTRISSAPYLLLLTGTARSLNKLFTVTEPEPGTFHLQPRESDHSMLRYVDISFAAGKLDKLVIQTTTGQRSDITFSNQNRDPIPGKVFQFTPPKDADVLR